MGRVGSGTHVADPGDTAWVEDPGYLGAHRAFQAAGLIPVPVDAEGLDLTRAPVTDPPARLVHVTPSHQFSLGVRMTLPRCVALLDWARSRGAWVLEDDYDGEFRYGGHPVVPLFDLDDSGRALYAGTFSKVLFPGLRLGYMVVPPALRRPSARSGASSTAGSSPLLQAALGTFMLDGRYARHLERMRRLYAKRQVSGG